LNPPSGARVLWVKTAGEMRERVLKLFPKTDILIMAAAVSDYRMKKVSGTKLKKGPGGLTLRLEKNRDILGEALGRRKSFQKVVGFAAETDHLASRAAAKWRRKPCDILVANRVGKGGLGFNSDQNELLVFRRGSVKPILLQRDFKSRLASKILDLL